MYALYVAHFDEKLHATWRFLGIVRNKLSILVATSFPTQRRKHLRCPSHPRYCAAKGSQADPV
jgi:hypothetical protein